MSQPLFTRFQTRILKDKSAADNAQIPAASASVDLLGQGATVSAAVTVPGDASNVQVSVYDAGDLAAGSVVEVFPSGGTLVVDSLTSSSQIRVSNGCGAPVNLVVGTRLLSGTPRAVAYADPLGTASQGSALLADTGGNVAAYISRKRLDYLVGTAPGVGFDATSSAMLEGGDTLTWSHTASGTGRCVLVAVCWSPLGSEGVDSVTYGGQSMVLTARSGTTAVYRLVNPPTGAQTIAVQFTPGSSVNAVGGAVSVTGADASAPIGLIRTASGTSTAASVSFSYVARGSLVFTPWAYPTRSAHPRSHPGAGRPSAGIGWSASGAS